VLRHPFSSNDTRTQRVYADGTLSEFNCQSLDGWGECRFGHGIDGFTGKWVKPLTDPVITMAARSASNV
jgi:hypothetical protein